MALLRFILDNDAWRREFREHLAAQHAGENVVFVERVAEMQREPEKTAVAKARSIVEDMVMDSGAHQVLLSEPTKTRLLELYVSSTSTSTSSSSELPKAFKPALDEVLRDLRWSAGFVSFVQANVEELSAVSLQDYVVVATAAVASSSSSSSSSSPKFMPMTTTNPPSSASPSPPPAPVS